MFRLSGGQIALRSASVVSRNNRCSCPDNGRNILSGYVKQGFQALCCCVLQEKLLIGFLAGPVSRKRRRDASAARRTPLADVSRCISAPLAFWSAITPLSEQSIDLGFETVEFPDFTGGQWMYRKPVFALNDDY